MYSVWSTEEGVCSSTVGAMGLGCLSGGSKPGWGVGRVGFCTGCLSRLGIWGQRAEEAARGWQKLLFPCKSGQHFDPWHRSCPPKGFEIIWEEKLSIRLPSVVLLLQCNFLWQHPLLTPWKAWSWKPAPKERHLLPPLMCPLMVPAWQALPKQKFCPKEGRRKRRGGCQQSTHSSQQAQGATESPADEVCLPSPCQRKFSERMLSSCKLKLSSARGQFQQLLLSLYWGLGLQHQVHHQWPSPPQGRQETLQPQPWWATSRGNSSSGTNKPGASTVRWNIDMNITWRWIV